MPSLLSSAAGRLRHAAAAVVASTVLVMALPVSAAAQEPLLEGRTIARIEMNGLRTLSAETLRFYLGIEEGAEYHAAEVNSKLHELWERNLIEDIEIEAAALGEGVLITIDVTERPTLKSIDYQGLKKVSRTDVTDRIARERIEVREGGPLNLGELKRLERAIERIYAEKGFRLADAEYRVESDSAIESRVIFTVDEGDKVRIGKIEFEGNDVFSDRRLRWSMKKTKESGFVSRLMRRDVYKVAEFNEDLDNVRSAYRKAGYKNVVLGAPELEILTKRRDKRRLAVRVPIEEGERWKFGEITIEGNEQFSDEALLTRFERPRGGWLRSTSVDEGLEAINELYSNTGYLYARVEPELIEREGEVADLTVRIEEGDQFKVGRVEFEGNVKTRDKVLRREMSVQEGIIISTGALRNSLLRIRQLEFFRVDEDDPVAFDVNEQDKLVDLTIKGEEGDRTEMLFGGGYSELDGVFGQFQFRTRNFLGRGETMSVSVQSGNRQEVFDLSYFVPFFLDRPQSIGVQAFKRSVNFSLLTGQRFVQEARGATLTYGRTLALFQNLSLSYSRYDAEDLQSQFTLDGELVEQMFDRTVSSLRLAYAFNRVDSRLSPTIGQRFTLAVDYAGGALGGNTNFVRPRVGYTRYWPVSKEGLKTVFAVNLESGLIKPLEGQQLFFNDRFFLGGERSVRGFRFRSLWVRDEKGETITDQFGFPLGGDRFVQANLEYHFLLGGPFRLLLFGDAGNVYGTDQKMDLGQMRYTSGVELQVTVPIFGAPLRFIWAQNLDPLPDDRFETFQFSIGSSF